MQPVNELRLEPLDTLLEVCEELYDIDDIGNRIYTSLGTIVWSKDEFNILYEELKEKFPIIAQKYVSVRDYIRDAEDVPFEIILNKESPSFSNEILLTLAYRIWDNTLAPTDKRRILAMLVKKVLIMMATDDNTDSTTARILYDLLESPNDIPEEYIVQ